MKGKNEKKRKETKEEKEEIITVSRHKVNNSFSTRLSVCSQSQILRNYTLTDSAVTLKLTQSDGFHHIVV